MDTKHLVLSPCQFKLTHLHRPLDFSLKEANLLTYMLLELFNSFPPTSYILSICHNASLLTLSYCHMPFTSLLTLHTLSDSIFLVNWYPYSSHTLHPYLQYINWINHNSIDPPVQNHCQKKIDNFQTQYALIPITFPTLSHSCCIPALKKKKITNSSV